MTGDKNAIGVRMVIQVHVFCFSEGGRSGVVPGGHVRGLPKSCRRASRHLQLAAFLRELGVFDRLPRLLGASIDLSGPSGSRDASTGNRVSTIHLRLDQAWMRRQEDER